MRNPMIGKPRDAAAAFPQAPTLVKIRLPRQSERTFQSVRNMLAAFGHLGVFSLEIVGDDNGIRMMARCGGTGASSFRRALVGYYPQSHIEEVRAEDDPMKMGENERAWTRSLTVAGHEALPLLTFDDEMTLPGTDPLLGIFGAMSSLERGERAVARLALTGKPHGWSEQYVAHAMSGVGSANQLAYDSVRAQEAPSGPNSAGAPVGLVPLAAAAMVGLNVYTSWNEGDMLKAFLVGGGALGATVVGGYVYFKFLKPKKPVYLDSRLVEKRVSGAVFDADIKLHVFQGPDGGESRANVILDDMASAYSHYDNPLGSRFEIGDVEANEPEEISALARLEGSAKVPTGLAAFKLLLPSGNKTSVMGSLEAASLWHPPSSEDDVHSMERMTSRALIPRYTKVTEGAFVGTDKNDSPILLPPKALASHHFYVARTRMGKSTMMRHIVEYKMQRKAQGKDDDAIVVIDPHSDLVHGLMELCPPEIADQVRVVDLGDIERVVGINLLDTAVFTDRDITCDGIVRVAKGLWDNWGSRMQNILEHLAKSMHEANALSDGPRSEQYTLLDGHDMLGISAESEAARKKMLDVLRDPYLKRWWTSEFASWDKRMKVEACAPVQTRLAYYASDQRARRVLGQPQSTLDIRQTIQDGGILLVATSQAYLGRNVSSLLGACILNLVDAVIRSQGTLPEKDRRGCLVVVDEMQSIPGVDYEGMLSEVGKFGGSLALATQSLTKLEELSPTMRDTILSNIGVLSVFQVSSSDARILRNEIGADRVEEYDIVSLPRHECYMKLSSLPGGVSTFSMRVRPPSEGNPASAARIREGMSRYTEKIEAVDELLMRRAEESDDATPSEEATPTARRRRAREIAEIGGGEDGTVLSSTRNSGA